jgi:rhodanese-related sulfurtransferase
MPSARFALFLAISLFASTLFAADPTDAPLAQVKADVDSGRAILVDVREKREWDAGHVEGAVFLPLGSIADGLSEEEAAKLPGDKGDKREKVVYLHCAIGLRAASAGELLEKQGYRVQPLDVDYNALVKAGFVKAKD